MIKRFQWIPFSLLLLLILIMAAFTIVGRSMEEESAIQLYSHPLVISIWGALVISSLYIIMKRKLHRIKSSFLFHISFLLILAGALTTHITSYKGNIHLRENESSDKIYSATQGERQLPFSLRLKSFEIIPYQGTHTAADFRSTLQLNSDTTDIHISMNRIFEREGYRFYQHSYDQDQKGTILMVSYDKWGVRLTYTGYLLLLVSILSILLDKNSRFRQLLHHPVWKSLILAGALWGNYEESQAAHQLPQTIDPATAEAMGNLLIEYQDRITTVEVYATDFTKKLTGKSHYHGLSATQVLFGWIFNPEEWQYEPMIKIKNSQDRELLGITGRARFVDFFNSKKQYKIKLAEIEGLRNGMGDKRRKELAKLDEKAEIIAMLESGVTLKIFPVQSKQGYHLIAPTDTAEIASVDEQNAMLIKNFFSLCYQSHKEGEDCVPWIEKLHHLQQNKLGEAAPSTLQLKAEHLYIHTNKTAIYSYIVLTVGILAFILLCIHLFHPNKRWNEKPFLLFIILSLLYLTYCITLRMIISGRLPFSNGHETLLTIGWLSQALAIIGNRKLKVCLPVGILVSGFALLASSLSDMDPKITPLMPVLNSPLLSIHVSLMMISYTLAGFITLISFAAILTHLIRTNDEVEERFLILNKLLLYPTLFTMTIGIFTGAIWANVSWGDYWAWDPKETWALITLLLYSFAFHASLIPPLQKSINMHLFLFFAFISLLVTYFGVNYFFGGMHSYGG